MTSTPGLPVVPGVAVGAMADGDDDGLGTQGSDESTDQGVPVGEADVDADQERAEQRAEEGDAGE